MPFSPLQPDSERKPQRELHESRRGQGGVIFPELCRIERQRRLRPAHIVAHRIGSIKRLPAELNSPLLAQREILAPAGVDVEHDAQ